jgi:hypothetical protein
LGLFLSWTTACADFSHALNLPVVVRPSLLCERLTGDFGTAAKDSLIGDRRATFVALQHQFSLQSGAPVENHMSEMLQSAK